MFESFAGSLNSFGSAFTPGGSVGSFLPATGSPFGSFGDYSNLSSSASLGGGGMFSLGGLALAGGLGIGQGLIGMFGQQKKANDAKQLAKYQAEQQRKLLDRQFDRIGELREEDFERQLAADSFGFGLERMGAMDSLRLQNSPDYMRAQGRQVGANIAGRFMDPTYAARTAQMFYG